MKKDSRRCELRTWDSNTQQDRTLKRATIVVGTPQQMIQKAAAILNPKRNVLSLHVQSRTDNYAPLLMLQFDSDAYVYIILEDSDVASTVAYVLSRTKLRIVMAIGEVNNDEGDELIVPKVSPAELEAMENAAGVH